MFSFNFLRPAFNYFAINQFYTTRAFHKSPIMILLFSSQSHYCDYTLIIINHIYVLYATRSHIYSILRTKNVFISNNNLKSCHNDSHNIVRRISSSFHCFRISFLLIIRNDSPIFPRYFYSIFFQCKLKKIIY